MGVSVYRLVTQPAVLALAATAIACGSGGCSSETDGTPEASEAPCGTSTCDDDDDDDYDGDHDGDHDGDDGGGDETGEPLCPGGCEPGEVCVEDGGLGCVELDTLPDCVAPPLLAPLASPPSVEWDPSMVLVHTDGPAQLAGTRASAVEVVRWSDGDFAVESLGGFSGGTALAAPGDLDGDGLDDLVVHGVGVAVSFGEPGGTFTAPAQIAEGNFCFSLTTVRWNNPAFVDLLCGDTQALYVLDGSGRDFTQPQELSDIFGNGIIAADVEGDSVRELIVASAGGVDAVDTASAGATSTSLLRPRFGNTPMLGRLSGDEDSQEALIAVSSTDDGIVIESLTKNATWRYGVAESSLAWVPGPRAADLDADGHEDVLWVEGQSVRWFKAAGDGSLTCQHTFDLGVPLSEFLVGVGDLDGDTQRELVVASDGSVLRFAVQ